MTAVDQTLTRADEKEKLILTNARIEQYDAIEAPLIDSESSKVSPVPLIVLYALIHANFCSCSNFSFGVLYCDFSIMLLHPQAGTIIDLTIVIV